ncbi:MAG: response regulator [Pseudomonadota bacterium]
MAAEHKTDAGAGSNLKGLRILVVEDQAPIALQLEDILIEQDCKVVGPASRVAQALRLAEECTVDAAVLDLNVAGELVYPVADAMAAQHVPFVFTTGFDTSGLNERYGNPRILLKPFSRRGFLQALRETLGQPPRPHGNAPKPGT